MGLRAHTKSRHCADGRPATRACHLGSRISDPSRLACLVCVGSLRDCFLPTGLAPPYEKNSLTEEIEAPSSAVLRGLGLGFLIALAASVAFGLAQTTEPNAGLAFATLGEIWQQLHPGSLEATKTTVQDYAPRLWDAGFLPALRLPALLFTVLIGFGLYRMGARWRDSTNSLSTEAEALGSEASSQPSVPHVSPRSELAQALSSCKSAFLSVGVFSGMSNVLMLTGAFFMLQIYDRVLPRRSVPTLVALAILVAVLFAFLAIIDMIRSRILVRIGASLDDFLSARVYDTIVRLPLKMGNRGDGVQPLRDLDAVRAFLSGPGPTARHADPVMLTTCFQHGR